MSGITENIYTERTYGISQYPLTDFDKIVFSSLQDFYINEKEEIDKRKCNIFLDKIVPNTVHKTCQFIKKNDEKCKLKAKSGEKFCGRHLSVTN
jgi:hypothetical protein